MQENGKVVKWGEEKMGLATDDSAPLLLLLGCSFFFFLKLEVVVLNRVFVGIQERRRQLWKN
jgi:hypothetical protein